MADSASDAQTFNEIAEGENKLSEISENVIKDVKSFDSGYHTRSAATEEHLTETTSESMEDNKAKTLKGTQILFKETQTLYDVVSTSTTTEIRLVFIAAILLLRTRSCVCL